MIFSPPASDIREIIANPEKFEAFRQKRILITGATGFVGTWFLQTLLAADLRYSLGLDLFCITRDASKLSNIENIKKVKILERDIREPFSENLPDMHYIFHAATPATPWTGGSDPELVYESAVLGTQNVLNFASNFAQPACLLHTSSGAVEKNYDENSASKIQKFYKEAKLIAEELITESTNTGLIIGCNPRLFAFAGPGISTTAHFAVGQFMNFGFRNESIMVKGNPNTMRSYMYPTDLVTWLLEIMKKPIIEPLRVGSQEEISIAKLAVLVSELFGGIEIINENEDKSSIDYYVPNTLFTQTKYQLSASIGLKEALFRWKNFMGEI